MSKSQLVKQGASTTQLATKACTRSRSGDAWFTPSLLEEGMMWRQAFRRRLQATIPRTCTAELLLLANQVSWACQKTRLSSSS